MHYFFAILAKCDLADVYGTCLFICRYSGYMMMVVYTARNKKCDSLPSSNVTVNSCYTQIRLGYTRNRTQVLYARPGN